MITKVKLFVSMKDEAVARSLGLRRLRRAPAHGQEFQIPLDGRPVRARITRFSTASDLAPDVAVPEVYADEI
jgi:hypothetical protein